MKTVIEREATCVRYVCPILKLWIIISSRRGKVVTRWLHSPCDPWFNRMQLVLSFGIVLCEICWSQSNARGRKRIGLIGKEDYSSLKRRAQDRSRGDTGWWRMRVKNLLISREHKIRIHLISLSHHILLFDISFYFYWANVKC